MTLNPFAIVGQIIAAILPDPIEALLRGLVDRINGILQGSPARAIGYGAGVVIYLVALAFDRIPDMTIDQAIGNAGFAITTLIGIVEAIRHYVFSPASVAAIVANPPTAAGPIAAAVTEGVPPALIADAAAGVALGFDGTEGADDGDGPVDEGLKGLPLPASTVDDEAEPNDELPEPGA